MAENLSCCADPESDAMHSRDDLVYNAAIHIGEAKISTCVPVGEPLMVQTQLVENRCLKIVDVYLAFDNTVTKVVRIAVSQTAFHAATSHPS